MTVPVLARCLPDTPPMNRTEAAYLKACIRPRELAREIVWWDYEPWKLRIGEKCFYTPDFVVVTAEGRVECHEVKATWGGRRHRGKAGWQEDARVKIKAAAGRYAFFRFLAAHPARGAWQVEEIQGR